jgi:hypothetical protein
MVMALPPYSLLNRFIDSVFCFSNIFNYSEDINICDILRNLYKYIDTQFNK